MLALESDEHAEPNGNSEIHKGRRKLHGARIALPVTWESPVSTDDRRVISKGRLVTLAWYS